jgi:hypothetical protein
MLADRGDAAGLRSFGVPADDEPTPRYCRIDVDLTKAARIFTAVVQLDHHPAAHDAGVAAIQALYPLTNSGFNCGGGVQTAK